MNRRGAMVATGQTSIEIYVDGTGADTSADVVILPSHGRAGSNNGQGAEDAPPQTGG